MITQHPAAIFIAVAFSILVLVTLFLGVRIVPQGEKHVVERLGKFLRILNPGLNLIYPYIDRVAYRMPTKDIVMDVPPQEVITRDNVVIRTNAIAFFNIVTPERAAYGVQDYTVALGNLVQTSLRSIVGEMTLDEALSSREMIKAKVKASITDDVAEWGITVKSVEVQDINPSPTMQQAMERQAAAERTRRATVAEAEGSKSAMILNAEGDLASARLEAEAKVVLAEATKSAIERITAAIGDRELPALYLLGERYIQTLEVIGKSENAKTVLLPADLQATLKGLLHRV
jgi:regulator of protease activity HflC (stomatin/prohibitin superfamily)